MTREEILDNFPDEEFLFADGFDEAILGLCYASRRVVYSAEKCLEVLQNSPHDMQESDALEYFGFNVAGAYVGEKTPIFIIQ